MRKSLTKPNKETKLNVSLGDQSPESSIKRYLQLSFLDTNKKNIFREKSEQEWVSRDRSLRRGIKQGAKSSLSETEEVQSLRILEIQLRWGCDSWQSNKNCFVWFDYIWSGYAWIEFFYGKFVHRILRIMNDRICYGNFVHHVLK